ncbi:MAG: ClpXP protease specificity-enhancing factor SspB [Deltaproteobacteria bacterium]
MPRTTIDYGSLMHRAMRGLIREVLLQIEADGLPGEHHFFITFDTTHPDTEMADWLSDRYPTDMTVVVQNWYENLEVTEDGFSITLNFGETPEPLYIPYDAIKTFVDPSVEFGLRFETQAEPQTDAETVAMPEKIKGNDKPKKKDDAPQKDAEVVSLDKFRK